MSSEETTIRERLKESLGKLEDLQKVQRKIFGSMGWNYAVDVSGIRSTVDGISNLETRCWNLRRKANEFKETLYSISDMMDSGETIIPPSEFNPEMDGVSDQNREAAQDLTRTCGAIALSIYSQIRSLFYQKMEDTIREFDDKMEKWSDVSSGSISSKMSMLSSRMKQTVCSELNKIVNNDYQVQILADAILNPETGQTMDGFMESTMNTMTQVNSECEMGKSELEQTVSDMFDQTLLALDDLNIKMKGLTLRTTASIAGQDFSINCADDMFMMNSRTTVQDDESSDKSSMKLAADFLLFSVDSMCQVVAFVSETTQRLLDFATFLGTWMSDSAKDLSEQMIDASAVASNRFMRVIGGISQPDMAKDFLPGLMDFSGDITLDEDFSKNVVGVASRVSQSLIDMGRESANSQLSTIGIRTSSMFENMHETIRKLAKDTEAVVAKVLGRFLTGQNSFTDESEYQETEPVLRMRSIGLQTREAYNTVEWEKSKTTMQTPWWENQLSELKSDRESYSKYEGCIKEDLVIVDATIKAMEKAIKSGDEEDMRLAAKMYTELSAVSLENGFYFADHCGYYPNGENTVTGLQLCRNLGVWSYADDGSNLLKSFTADTTINHPFWQEVMKHEAEVDRKNSPISKAILKAILSQDDEDMANAMKLVLEKYGPGTRVGENAMSLATNKSLFNDKDDPEYWSFDGLDDYWKKLGASKNSPLQIHEILESDLFDDSVRDLYRKLQQTKDPEDLRKLFATMAQYIPSNSPLLQALKDNVRKKYGFKLDDYIADHFKEYTSEDWKKQLAEESARRRYDSNPFGSDNSYDSYGGDSTSSSGDSSSAESSSKMDDNYPLFYWRGQKLNFFRRGLEMLMHDGDQQVFNPYGHPTGKWTMYSFRPQDTLTNVQEENYPMIAITPSSFQSLKTINRMLNSIPFVVVREFFFKNQAGNIVNFIKGVSKGAADIFKSVTGKAEGITHEAESEEGRKNETTMKQVEGAVRDFMEQVKNVFQNVDIKVATIDIPYILYCGLRNKQWGNTYIFPYIVDSSTVINESSNDSEWNGEGSGLLQWIKDATQSVTNFIGGAATSIVGSQAMPADLFPAPTWSNQSKEKISFSFPLVLINDHIVKARNNYMCVNTIIHNNRWMQKAVLAFPGALYELWLPTGQRHLMCTGSFKLYPLGLNRFTPFDFFEGYDWDSKGGDKGLRGADFEIGTVVGLPGAERDSDTGELTSKIRMPNPHISGIEVIPDAYKLEITFTSCLANNMNTAVFQYYVKMAAFNNYKGSVEEDWKRNEDGDFSSISGYGEKVLEVLSQRMQDPDSKVNFPDTNTGNAADDNGTLSPEALAAANGNSGQNGTNNANGGNGSNANGSGGNDGNQNDTDNKEKSTPHYVPMITPESNYGLKESDIMAVNYRIIQYNRGDIDLDSFFQESPLDSYSDERKMTITNYLTQNDKGTDNPANNETHNVPLVMGSTPLYKKFGTENIENLNDRINDYNRGEITLDQFFASYSGLQGISDGVKAEVLRYLMDNDKPENAPKLKRHSVLLVDVPEQRLKQLWKNQPDSSQKENWEWHLRMQSHAINSYINLYNAGEKSMEEMITYFSGYYDRNIGETQKMYNRDDFLNLIRNQLTATDTTAAGPGEKNNQNNVSDMTIGQFTSSFNGLSNDEVIVDGKRITGDQLKDLITNKTQSVVRIVNTAIQQYNSGKTMDQATAYAVDKLKSRSDITTMKELGYTPENVEAFIKNHLAASTSKSYGFARQKTKAPPRQRVYSRSQTSSETYIEKFNEATYNKKLQKIKTSIGDVPIDADSAVLEIQNAQRTIRETTQFLSKLYNAENNNLWWKPFEREKLYYTLTPDARVVLRQRYGEKFISLKDMEVKIQNTTGTLDRINEELSKIPDLAERNPLLEKKVAVTRDLNRLEQQKDMLSDELIQIDTDLIRDAFDEHDAVVSIKRRDITPGIFQQVWNEKIMNSYEREQMQYLTSDEKKRYFDDKIREMSKWDTHEILKKRDWFFRVVVMDFIVGEMKVLVQWFKECTYQDFETVYRIVRKLRLLRLDFEQAVAEDDFKINRTNLFRMTEKQIMDFKRLDKILTGSTLYDLFLSQLELQFPQAEDEDDSGKSGTGKSLVDREIVQERESEENLFAQRSVRQDVVARYWGSETELTRAAYDKVCKGLTKEDEKITVYLGDSKNSIAEFDSIGKLKNEIMRLKIAGDDQDRLQSLLGAFTSYVNLAKEAMVTEKMNEMVKIARQEIKVEDQSVNAKVMSEGDMEDIPFPSDYK